MTSFPYDRPITRRFGALVLLALWLSGAAAGALLVGIAWAVSG